MTISDIVNKTYFYTKTNATSFSAANMLILINDAYNRVASLIMQVDGRWIWDDTNNTDFPIGTTNLVTTVGAEQQDYSLAVTYIAINRVEVKDSAGNFQELQPIDQYDIKAMALSEFMKSAGMPQFYDKIGSSIFLYPKPLATAVTSTAGLKVFFQRPPALYTSAEVTTGTKTPGFNSLYHDIIPLWVSYDYALANGLPNANQLFAEIQRKEEALVSDYEMRSKDEGLKMRTAYHSSR